MKIRFSQLAYILTGLLLFSCQPQNNDSSTVQEIVIDTPEKLYGDLFYDVQMRTDLFPDSKTFVDCIPKKSPSEIQSAYKELENKEDAEVMKSFLDENFHIPGSETAIEVAESQNASEHIRKLWSFLERPADQPKSGTLIPLPNPYVVPGGRFREVYYWDSYFTMLGLQVDGKNALMENIVNNFSHLIDSVGFIPNGNRMYYNSRSQPPFYSLMVKLHVENSPDNSLADYLSSLLGEYNFWMDGVDEIDDMEAYRRVIKIDDGFLNRYWDNKAEPRAESYREDVETAAEAIEKNPELIKEKAYRHLRAGAESGWDYSTRWFDIQENGEFDLSSIHTTDILPVDLNSLMYHLEVTISEAYQEKGDDENATTWMEKANLRKSLIHKHFWNDETGFYMDYDFQNADQTPVKSLAGMYPLFFGISSNEQAARVAEVIEGEFLMPGGVVTTLNDSGQQWDYPNGWAPLQWMTIKGLSNYDQQELADKIASRWLALNDKVFANTGKMTEKYNVVDLALDGGGGEYPNQDGFGWTNGVYQKLNSTKR